MIRVGVLYDTRYGATAQLANHVANGVLLCEQTEVVVRTVPPVSSGLDIRQDPVPKQGPPYATLEELATMDGLAVGSPTRFGNMSAAMKHFWDSTSGLWLSGALKGKPAAVFTSSSSMHGGQESTLLSMMLPLLHHGMLITGLPFTETELVHTQTGGTPYGASHVAGPDSSREISSDEAILAQKLGRRLALAATRLCSKEPV